MFGHEGMRETLLEPFTQLCGGLLSKGSETRHGRIFLHQLNHGNYSITVLSRGLEPILEQPLELSIMLAVDTSEYLHILQGEFERSGFESKVSGGV